MPQTKELRRVLSAAVREGVLSHAVLIEGEKGTGRRELALWLAKAILCKNSDPPCEHCAVCRKITDGNHPDVEIYSGNGTARSFKIDSIREIKNSIWLAPNEAEQRIYILLGIEDMTIEAQNALLKSLEEPPEHARFIMTCENRELLLDTIISRATVYALDPPTEEECSAAVKKRFPELSDEDAALAAAAFGGNTGGAFDALEKGKLPIIKLAAKTPELMRRGMTYALASSLTAEAGDRVSFSDYLEYLGAIVGNCGVLRAAGKTAPVKVSAAEAVKTSEIIGRAKGATVQNCSVELIQSWLCMELKSVFGGNI